MKRCIFIFVGLCFPIMVNAQVILPDSVQTLLNQPKKDSAYVIRLNKIAFECLKSNPELGRELASRTMASAKQIDFVRGIARSLDITGSSFWVVGDYESALKYYQLSANESRSVHDSVGLSSVYHNIGEVYKKLHDYDKAIEFLNLSLKWDKKSKNHLGITLYNIGEAYLFKNEIATALEYFQKSLNEGMEEKSNRTIAYSYYGLGIIGYRNKDYRVAMDYFLKSEELWKKLEEYRSLIQTYQDFASVFSDLHYFEKAKKKLEEAIALASKIHALDLQINNYLKLSALYSKQGIIKKRLKS